MTSKTELYIRVSVNGLPHPPITGWMETDEYVPGLMDDILVAYHERYKDDPMLAADVEKHLRFIREELVGYSREQLRVRRSVSLDMWSLRLSVEYFVWDMPK